MTNTARLPVIHYIDDNEAKWVVITCVLGPNVYSFLFRNITRSDNSLSICHHKYAKVMCFLPWQYFLEQITVFDHTYFHFTEMIVIKIGSALNIDRPVSVYKVTKVKLNGILHSIIVNYNIRVYWSPFRMCVHLQISLGRNVSFLLVCSASILCSNRGWQDKVCQACANNSLREEDAIPYLRQASLYCWQVSHFFAICRIVYSYNWLSQSRDRQWMQPLIKDDTLLMWISKLL